MDQQQLVETLKLLHRELSDATEVDEAAIALLKTVTEDIERVIDSSEAEHSESAETSAHGLRELLLRFKGEHPHMANMIEQITDGLANLGI